MVSTSTISGAEENCGKILIERRLSPERTGFYLGDIFPPPYPPPATKTTMSTGAREDAHPIPIPATATGSHSSPNCGPLKLLFGVKIVIQNIKTLQRCDIGYLHIEGGVSRSGCNLFLKEQPSKRKQGNNKFISFSLHHEKSHSVYNKKDPKMKCSFSREEKLKYGSQAYQKWFDSKAIALLPTMCTATTTQQQQQEKDQ
ncbi:hypothetical protein BDA99DRAFT_590107 [Phascolomyces articulosus]|uniref:Uncharacterized protein n=1 Tax=Phascolomyces articulosus TaxID=60185 RepID=A0AAD5P9I5_9FUNG|nr:hypothetical protein BDA99DRAFT_590107 [Phascolomyces articulosus]